MVSLKLMAGAAREIPVLYVIRVPARAPVCPVCHVCVPAPPLVLPPVSFYRLSRQLASARTTAAEIVARW